MTQISMLDHPSIAGPRKSDKDRWFAKVRAELLRRYAGRLVTSDDIWIIAAEPGFEKPASVHPNSLGPFFPTWDQATPVGHWHEGTFYHETRPSQRRREDGTLMRNDLRLWRLKGTAA